MNWKKITIVGLLGGLLTLIIVLMISVLNCLLDMKADFGIIALVFICIKLVEETWNKLEEE